MNSELNAPTPRETSLKTAWLKVHPFPHITDIDERCAEFDRCMARVRAEALREAAREWRAYTHATSASAPCAEWWLNKRADKMIEDANDE